VKNCSVGCPSSVGYSLALRVQDSLKGCSIAHKCAAELKIVQRSLVRCILAQQGAAKFRGYSVVQKGAAKLSRMQHCSVKCSVAQEVAA
jgi:hypothetical protein